MSELKDNNLEKPYYPVNLDKRLIPLIIEIFGEEVEKIDYADGSIAIILKENEGTLPTILKIGYDNG